MDVFYDLHIHSALSPCGDEDMTPNNIVNMARIKGLDLIALTDHNCCRNVPAVWECAKKAGIMFLPGIELNTAEEVHLLGYFFDVDSAVDFGEKVYDALPDIKNVPEYFGRQLILNQNDEIIGEADKLLISALPWSFEQAADNIMQAGGVPVPAHINKGANSLISNLGMIPETDGIFTLEISDKGKQTDIDSNRYNILTSSDAHFLWDISEKTHCLSLKRNFISNVFDYIKGNLK